MTELTPSPTRKQYMKFTSLTMRQKINQIISALRKHNIPGTLYIEGSYAKGSNDKYSDIDLSLEVGGKDYNTTTKRIGYALRSLHKPLYILDYGEDPKFPGYYYIWAMYKDLGPFQIIDFCILDKSKRHYRGKRKVLYKRNDKDALLISKIQPTEKLTKKQKEIVKLYFLQPGLIKKLIRKESDLIIQKSFGLKLISQIKPFCSKQEIKEIDKILENHKWSKVFIKGLRLFEAKTKKIQPSDNNFYRLKNKIEELNKLL